MNEKSGTYRLPIRVTATFNIEVDAVKNRHTVELYAVVSDNLVVQIIWRKNENRDYHILIVDYDVDDTDRANVIGQSKIPVLSRPYRSYERALEAALVFLPEGIDGPDGFNGLLASKGESHG